MNSNILLSMQCPSSCAIVSISSVKSQILTVPNPPVAADLKFLDISLLYSHAQKSSNGFLVSNIFNSVIALLYTYGSESINFVM